MCTLSVSHTTSNAEQAEQLTVWYFTYCNERGSTDSFHLLFTKLHSDAH